MFFFEGTVFVNQLEDHIKGIVDEWLESGYLKKGNVFVVGCSTSEVAGEHIGTSGSEEIAAILFKQLTRLKEKAGVQLAFQCCEHLNRAIVVEEETALQRQLEEVSAIPVRKAGGSMAAYAYKHFDQAVVVEGIRADAGIDIGETMIGMHLKRVAVPLRLKQRYVGNARVNAARTRPRLIGGERAVYSIEEQGNCD
ncbi:TIGR01440 family protein [Aquibacillus kalidii]|uniref:TIGR01440 family protein n=1 Tax=Aquibacillus kalidii TaxID=2762597 RepID=UPI001645559D|nr:TIGR01440 family protein [Aquibacillus kalidii]